MLLDVLRGVAILGTLATNIWIFTDPAAEYGVLVDTDSITPLAGSPVETVFRFLANGKFLALLTILFGVGLAIQHASASRRGERWPGRYRWRAVLLFVEGTLHFLLVFAFDVLMGYAVTALVVAGLLGRSRRVQHAVFWTAGTLHLALMLLGTAALLAEPDPEPATNPRLVTLFSSRGYLDQVLFRIDNLLALRLEPILTFGLMLFLFLLGVRLFRAGAFGADETGRRIRRRLAGLGLGLGLPLNAATTLGGPDLFLIDRYVLPPLVTLGYLGLIGMLLDRLTRPGAAAPVLASGLTAGLASVGRTALSCYVLQNLLCAAICYGWGLGLATRLADARPWWVLGLWVAVCTVLVVGARLWLRRFTQGPLESVQKALLARV
ncbi:DUF418 domain-containing protein [Micromonospora sp. HM5-17]|jgi:uncharacterized protein|uniref:DUF418 domain-containing protein n=1 Tax=Micromonospora sp. HM5-17 TaxID=2487710 RepID=UPI0018F78A59|nr:DUF418 domain-containing protein [Micromonospora sp. HM5-17]